MKKEEMIREMVAQLNFGRHTKAVVEKRMKDSEDSIEAAYGWYKEEPTVERARFVVSVLTGF